MKLPDKIYDILKWVAIICLPALAVFYGTVGVTWGFPAVEQIVITINAVGVLLGALIGVSTVSYNKLK